MGDTPIHGPMRVPRLGIGQLQGVYEESAFMQSMLMLLCCRKSSSSSALVAAAVNDLVVPAADATAESEAVIPAIVRPLQLLPLPLQQLLLQQRCAAAPQSLLPLLLLLCSS
jgi:hypothetical protein